ncbi:hypothetical protein CYPRO_3250 [Cyclonatronum proteinivorum]|uniref:Uncharacterized protein n=1 Tax=Cyclonatronum proteinivorum TaxID=1457365 RepID=A0A345UPT1_9BACT|nr:hypothetical protein CYPRO_3250 [Cyclonatronum proteinivorum]
MECGNHPQFVRGHLYIRIESRIMLFPRIVRATLVVASECWNDPIPKIRPEYLNSPFVSGHLYIQIIPHILPFPRIVGATLVVAPDAGMNPYTKCDLNARMRCLLVGIHSSGFNFTSAHFPHPGRPRGSPLRVDPNTGTTPYLNSARMRESHAVCSRPFIHPGLNFISAHFPHPGRPRGSPLHCF